MKELKKYLNQVVRKNPELVSEVNEFYNLCLEEIENGESKQNEIDLCIESVKQLLN